MGQVLANKSRRKGSIELARGQLHLPHALASGTTIPATHPMRDTTKGPPHLPLSSPSFVITAATMTAHNETKGRPSAPTRRPRAAFLSIIHQTPAPQSPELWLKMQTPAHTPLPRSTDSELLGTGLRNPHF